MIDNTKELHLIIPLVVALFLNFVISVKGWDNGEKSLLPSSPYIGIIWIFILISLGNAHYILYKNNDITIASLFLI